MLLNLFDPNVNKDIVTRIQSLSPQTPQLWGKMNGAQMMAHVSGVLELALGDRVEPPTTKWKFKLLKPLIKRMVLSEKPYKKGLPTGDNFVVSDEKAFAAEQKRIIELVERFAKQGEQGITQHPHPIFGKLSAEEWSKNQWKHLDHHLRQFGV